MWVPCEQGGEKVEVGEEAFWSTSSAMTGHDVAKLRDDSRESYWMSVGEGPHHINIQFPREKTIQELALYVDHNRDQPYIPSEVSVRAGPSSSQMQEVNSFRPTHPTGWISLILSNSISFVRAAVIQIAIMQPSMVRIRQVKIYGPSPQREESQSHAKLVADYRRLLNNAEFSDVEFLVEGRKIYAHKVILSARSECFRAMFGSGMRETREKEIEITDVSHKVFVAMLEYIYTEECKVTPEIAMELLVTADRYGLDTLKALVEDVMAKGIDLHSVSAIFEEANRHQATRLKDQCMDFIVSNAQQFVETEGFHQLDPDLLRDIFKEYVSVSKLRSNVVWPKRELGYEPPLAAPKLKDMSDLRGRGSSA